MGVFNSRQARILKDDNSETIAMRAALGAVADAGLTPRDIDGVIGTGGATDFIYQHRIGPVWRSMSGAGIPAVLEAAAAIAAGFATTVLIAAGTAGVYTERDSTAPWTRPTHEFVVAFGMFTAAEFALVAARHMEQSTARRPNSWPPWPRPSATTATSIPRRSTTGGGRSRPRTFSSSPA